VFNDTADAFSGELVVDLYTNGENLSQQASYSVILKAHDVTVVDLSSLFDEFTDLNYAYRFGPPKYNLICTSLKDETGAARSDDIVLPRGQAWPLEGDIGLSASTISDGAESHRLRITTQRFAQWVSVSAPGYRPSDSWFHLPPRSEKIVTLHDGDPSSPPRGRVRALNSTVAAVIRPEGE
jgi:beta-mannosidase